LAWAAITTVVFIGSRLYQSKKGVECALCDDIPKTDNTNNEK